MINFPCRTALSLHRIITAIAILWVTSGLSPRAFSQTKKDSPVTVVRAGKLFDSEKGVFLKDQYITISDRMVESVGPIAPKDAKGLNWIDLSAYTVLPGLIDCHTHLLFLESIQPSGAGLSIEGLKAITMEGDALRALRGAARAKSFLEAGITTVQDLGNSGQYADVALKRAIAEGSVAGCRMLVSGPGLSTEGGQLPGLAFQHLPIAAGDYRIVRGVDDAVAAVREHLAMNVDVIKIYSDSAPNAGRLSIEEMAAIVKEAHRYGLRVAAHAVHDQSIKDAVLAGVDSIEHAYSFTDETLQLITQKKVTVIPTFLDRENFIRYLSLSGTADKGAQETQYQEIHKMYQDVLSRLMKAGVTIASGSDNYVNLGIPQGQGAKRVLYAYAESGMGVLGILKTTSINASRHLGLENFAGVIKPGAWADIIAVEGNLENDIRILDNVRFVMKSGKVFTSAPVKK